MACSVSIRFPEIGTDPDRAEFLGLQNAYPPLCQAFRHFRRRMAVAVISAAGNDCGGRPEAIQKFIRCGTAASVMGNL